MERNPPEKNDMTRIYLDANIAETATLPEQEHHYLKNVLRSEAGDQIEVLTPNELLTAEIVELSKRTCIIRVLTRRELAPERYKFTVFQAILKREYMDTVIETYTELGVTEIVPVVSRYSQPELKDNAMRRYLEIAKKAALQSERERLPIIREAVKLADITPIDGDNIIFYERGERAMPKISANTVAIVIGPEGGFTDSEFTSLQRTGFVSATPFSQILKAETAAIVFAGQVRIAIGNL
jgi:16S rRNA (uracil1498-N3)-methyltransferase